MESNFTSLNSMFKPYIEGAINSHNRNGYWDYDSDFY